MREKVPILLLKLVLVNSETSPRSCFSLAVSFHPFCSVYSCGSQKRICCEFVFCCLPLRGLSTLTEPFLRGVPLDSTEVFLCGYPPHTETYPPHTTPTNRHRTPRQTVSQTRTVRTHPYPPIYSSSLFFGGADSDHRCNVHHLPPSFPIRVFPLRYL